MVLGKISREKYVVDFTEALSLALILEVSAHPKPGNVHRLRDRPKLRYEAFLATGILAYKYFKRGIIRGMKWSVKDFVLGDLVYGLVRDVIKKANSSNTCLGSSLLLSLLSVSAGKCILNECVRVEDITSYSSDVIRSTTVLDSIYYYMAIRLASPSYIKPCDYTAQFVNVWDPLYRKKLLERNQRLYDILQYSSNFDIVAREAINGFSQCLEAERFLRSRVSKNRELNRSIVETYLYLLSRNLDTVIYLKHGRDVAKEISSRAASVLDTVLNSNSNWINAVLEFDRELHGRGLNPGATADLVAATLALYMFRNIMTSSTLLDLSY